MVDDALHKAGRLLQFGLKPKERPQGNEEYSTLVTYYLDDREFRAWVLEIAAGLGLRVLQAGIRGLVLAPLPESIFGMTWGDYSAYGEDRLINGLIHVAIMTTVFPRPQNLEEDPTVARPPVTVDAVESMLRDLCQVLAEKAREQPDPAANDELSGLQEAWRVYAKQPSTAETSRRSVRPTRTLITDGLEFLHEQGCFVRGRAGEKEIYRPTWRYQVMVQDASAIALHTAVSELLTSQKATNHRAELESKEED